MMDAVEILRGAAREVERGWCRGQLQDDDENVCSLGAIRNARKALRLHPIADRIAEETAADALARTFTEQYPDYNPANDERLSPFALAESVIWRYNDYAVPDGAAVVACMEKAANSLEA